MGVALTFRCMSLRITLVPDSAHASSLAGGARREGPSSRDEGARRGRRAAQPVTTTTGCAEIPAAPAAPPIPAWDAPLEPLLEVSRARTEPICLRPAIARTPTASEETRIGAPLPPARTTSALEQPSTPEAPRLDATIICKNPILRAPEPDEEGGTLVMLTTPSPAMQAPASLHPHAMTEVSTTTEAGTVICMNPLLLVPELPAMPVLARTPELGTPQPVADGVPEATPVPAQMAGATAVFLGRLNDATPDDRTPIFVPEGESLEVGSKRGSPFARDPYVARYHAALVPMADGVLVEDFGTANGVYVRAESRVPLRDDDRLRIGQQLLRFLRFVDDAGTEDSVRRVGSPDPGAWGRLAIMLDAHREAAAYPLRTDIVELGQQTGDVQFPCDASVGEPHCRLVRGDDGPAVDVEPGGPATYVRVDRGDVVPYGTELLIGETRVRLDRAG
jgi:pSer/pThr/pTyr-binding forkhead associated (FHA) protein